MEERRNDSNRKIEQVALQHEAKARQLEEQINALSKAARDEQVNQRIKALQSQVLQERQEAANLRRKAA